MTMKAYSMQTHFCAGSECVRTCERSTRQVYLLGHHDETSLVFSVKIPLHLFGVNLKPEPFTVMT